MHKNVTDNLSFYSLIIEITLKQYVSDITKNR